MITATLDRPTRSHSISLEIGNRALKSEEFYPTLTVSGLPRVGTVEVTMSADRYTSSNGDWSEWRIYVRDVKPSNGIGDATRKLIRDACTPVVLEWLASEQYPASRQRAVARAVSYVIRDEGARGYGVDRARETIAKLTPDLDPAHVARFTEAADHLAAAAELLTID